MCFPNSLNSQPKKTPIILTTSQTRRPIRRHPQTHLYPRRRVAQRLRRFHPRPQPAPEQTAQATRKIARNRTFANPAATRPLRQRPQPQRRASRRPLSTRRCRRSPRQHRTHAQPARHFQTTRRRSLRPAFLFHLIPQRTRRQQCRSSLHAHAEQRLHRTRGGRRFSRLRGELPLYDNAASESRRL